MVVVLPTKTLTLFRSILLSGRTFKWLQIPLFLASFILCMNVKHLFLRSFGKFLTALFSTDSKPMSISYPDWVRTWRHAETTWKYSSISKQLCHLINEWMGMNLPQLRIHDQFRSSKIMLPTLLSLMMLLTSVSHALNCCFCFASDQSLQVVHIDTVCNPRLFGGRNKPTRPLKLF